MARTDKPSPMLVARDIVKTDRKIADKRAALRPFESAGWTRHPNSSAGMIFLELEDFKVSAFAWKSGFKLRFRDEDYCFVLNVFLPCADPQETIEYVEGVKREYESLR